MTQNAIMIQCTTCTCGSGTWKPVEGDVRMLLNGIMIQCTTCVSGITKPGWMDGYEPAIFS